MARKKINWLSATLPHKTKSTPSEVPAASHVHPCSGTLQMLLIYLPMNLNEDKAQELCCSRSSDGISRSKRWLLKSTYSFQLSKFILSVFSLSLLNLEIKG